MRMIRCLVHDTVQLTKRSKMHLVMLQGELFEGKKQAGVLVLVHDMSSECALQMHEVSLKYL